jgi:hypothetical protein
MLFSRAMSNGTRWYTPDIFGGPVYTPEELNAPLNETGEYINTTAAPVRQLQAAQAANSEDAQLEKERAAIVKDIFTTCGLLNEAGDKVKDKAGKDVLWKSGSLKDFINREFQVSDGLESLSVEYLNKLQGILTLRLDGFTQQRSESLLP